MAEMKKFYQAHTSNTGRCAILVHDYVHTLTRINELVAAAKADFPHLEDDDINVTAWAGPRYSGRVAVEFDAPQGGAPDGYKSVQRFEDALL